MVLADALLLCIAWISPQCRTCRSPVVNLELYPRWACRIILDPVEAKQKWVGVPFVSRLGSAFVWTAWKTRPEQLGKPGLWPVGKGQVLQVFPEEKLALPAVTWEPML